MKKIFILFMLFCSTALSSYEWANEDISKIVKERGSICQHVKILACEFYFHMP